MKELKAREYKRFEDIKQISSDGTEFWSARELAPALEYTKWENFQNVIKRAMIACENSGHSVEDDFPEVRKIVNAGISKKPVVDYELTRYACYLIVQNANPKYKTVALGQTYFAIQTRKMELTEEEYSKLNEDEKRLYRRQRTRDGNKALYKVAVAKGVKNFDKFTNAGYRGLYNGETADDISKRKGLRYREEILDYMGSSELVANEFRIVQTEELLSRQKEKSEKEANDTHFMVGKTVREAIEKLGNTMPENLPTPKKSIKELEKEELKRIK